MANAYMVKPKKMWNWKKRRTNNQGILLKFNSENETLLLTPFLKRSCVAPANNTLIRTLIIEAIFNPVESHKPDAKTDNGQADDSCQIDALRQEIPGSDEAKYILHA